MTFLQKFFVIFFVFLSCSTFAEPLKTIEEIRNLPPEIAAEGLPVEIKSQIVWVDPLRGSFFVNDGKLGIFVGYRIKPGETSEFIRGDWVQITGKTDAGNYAPTILPEKIVQLENGPLPEARDFWGDHLFSPNIDCDWMKMHGRLISYEVFPDPTMRLITAELLRENRSIFVHIPYSEASEERLSKLLFEWVYFNAVASTVHNENRQTVGKVFYISSADDFNVRGATLRKSLDGLSKAVPINELLRIGQNQLAVVKTEGTVTYANDREIFLRGDNAALQVQMQNAPELKEGDFVEVVGLPWGTKISPAFRGYRVKFLEHREAPTPVKIDSVLSISSALNFDLVEIEAELVEVGTSFGAISAKIQPNKEITLLCRSGENLFEARLPANCEEIKGLEPGAKLRLTGLCHAMRSEWRKWMLNLIGFSLQLRSADDVVIIENASWWTKSRLFWLAGGAAGFALLFLGWVSLLRKTVSKQTGIISEKIEQEAVLQERQRIARELHDNLEQGIAGAIFQLGGFRRMQQRIFKDLELSETEEIKQCDDAILTVERILRRCSEESRSTILELRGGLLERMDFVSAVRVSLENLQEERGVKTQLKIDGEIRRFNQSTERNLLLFIKEATENAAKHSESDEICVELIFSDAGFSVSISEDGKGFDVEKARKSGRFGLLGMKERVEQIGGKLEISSRFGEGSLIKATFLSCEGVEF